VNHRGRDLASHEYLGETPLYNAPIYVDREFIKADLRIATGLIEPHFMAGYSGGRKAVFPGICAFESIKVLHGPAPMAHEKAVECIMEGNPVHSEALHVAKKARVDFIVNVTLNERRQITGVFAGDLEEAHEEGVRFMSTQCRSEVDAPVDAVITSAAGFPLDLTFYQTVKGMTAAAGVLREGGVVIIVSRCAEGIGSPEFTRLILETMNCEGFLADIRKPGVYTLDQWQLQKLCSVLEKHEVWLYSDGIDRETQKKLFVTPLESIEAGIGRVKARFGDNARIAVIPEGPYVYAALKK
jgi:nickel-dependent lactate racemase